VLQFLGDDPLDGHDVRHVAAPSGPEDAVNIGAHDQVIRSGAPAGGKLEVEKQAAQGQVARARLHRRDARDGVASRAERLYEAAKAYSGAAALGAALNP
jgi:hypothetical protein